MTFPNPGPASQSTGNVAGGPYVAWSGTNVAQVIGPAGSLVNLGGGVGGVALYDGANSITSGTAQFSNANGVSFGFNGQTITASVVTSYTQTNQTVASGGIAGSGFTTATTAGTAVVGTHNSAGLSLGVPAYITTYAAGAATGISSIADSANTQTVGMLSFANSHGISFGISTGALTATITASAANAVPGISSIADNANTQTVGMLSFANSNGVTFGLSTGANTATVTASVNFAGLLSNINVSAGTTSSNISAVTFSNANGLSFGFDGTNISGSYTVPATAGFAGTNSSFGGTNVSGSMTLNTSGLTLSISAANPAAGNPTTVSWYENIPHNNLTWSGASASFNVLGSMALQPIQVNAPITFYRAMAMESMSTGASVITYQQIISGGQGSTAATGSCGSTFTFALFSRVSTGTNVNSSNISSFTSTSWTRSYGLSATYSNATNVSTASATISTTALLGWQLNNIDSQGNATSSSTGFGGFSSHSATTNALSTITTTALCSAIHPYMAVGGRILDIPLAGSLSPGEYWCGLQLSSATSNNGFQSGGANLVSFTQGIACQIIGAAPIYIYGSSQNTANGTYVQQGLGKSFGSAGTGAAFALSSGTDSQGINTYYAFMAQTK